VDLHATADLTADRATAFAALADLGTYPHWLGIVAAAAPAGEGAWLVDLRGKVGPFTKTKRVRMARTALDTAAGTVRFEREELDGRSHNPWILTGRALGAGTGSRVEVHVHYGGGLLLPGADLLLRQETRNAGARLDAHLAANGPNLE
jgi:hypothetical protein